MEAIQGWCIVENTMSGYEIVWRTGEYDATMPMILETEELVYKEIAENLIDQLQEFLDGDRELADTAFETMEQPAEIEIDEQGIMTLHVPVGELVKISKEEWRKSL